MTLRAVTSADLSWELSAIIYPAEIQTAELMQFSVRKEDVAYSTYFQLKPMRGRGSYIDFLFIKIT